MKKGKKISDSFEQWFAKEYSTIDVFHKEMMRVAFVAGQKCSENDSIRLDWLDELSGGAAAAPACWAGYKSGLPAPRWVQITRSSLGRWEILDGNDADIGEEVNHSEIADSWGGIRDLIDRAALSREMSPRKKS